MKAKERSVMVKLGAIETADRTIHCCFGWGRIQIRTVFGVLYCLVWGVCCLGGSNQNELIRLKKGQMPEQRLNLSRS